MAPTKKTSGYGVSGGGLLDLRAEVARQTETLKARKAAGESTSIVGGVKRPDKKPTVWTRANKGVKNRAARDLEVEEASKVTQESIQAALERKAKIYDKLRKGKSGGLNERQYDALLVDFDSKYDEDAYESDSDEVDESLTVPKAPNEEEDDPTIEYEDEFGRIRTAPRSEVPRHLLPKDPEFEVADDEDVIHNPVNFFPVYEPTAERVKQVEDAFAEADNPLAARYDPTQEIRDKGAAFYRFSADEEARRQQQEELRAAHEETSKVRQEMGAADVRPGEVEGMQPEEASQAGPTRSRAMEKRKREIEERRKLLEAKRRKVKGGDVKSASPTEPAEPSQPAAVDTAPFDPFAALEQQQTKPKAKDKQSGQHRPAGPSGANPADDFLAQLEQDMLKSR
ncbi:hypothetical protein CONPUDRAFT_151027 [Coniophora puteana RWD-64-598 SS2]|uniref:Uncharacterized protein n=1 Tax=Coniophora puteana (strain RWD-64-598) TaxID=741705 RepID=A0A5M3MZD1_CONPW|nr:uncharacterized protein CONPUDRAFT_151027 [Coniophora puteana RWD-64-598 SS2]EIW83981.1 hypothetical protein CONPUDRAFT_151027 [Coniophora puteana RWD-64-598 SS2]